jgi:hypothetical protein
MNPHQACGIVVFADEKQIDTCANSLVYKRSYAMHYAMYGFIITLVILLITSSFFIKNGEENKNTNLLIILFFGFILAGVTYLTYNWGYESADRASVELAYSQDKQELDSRKGHTTREDNVADLIQDRQRVAAAYNQGYQTNNRFNSRNSNSRIFNNGFSYNF